MDIIWIVNSQKYSICLINFTLNWTKKQNFWTPSKHFPRNHRRGRQSCAMHSAYSRQKHPKLTCKKKKLGWATQFGINRCQSWDPRTSPGIKKIQFYLVKVLQLLNPVFDIKMDGVNVVFCVIKLGLHLHSDIASFSNCTKELRLGKKITVRGPENLKINIWYLFSDIYTVYKIFTKVNNICTTLCACLRVLRGNIAMLWL
jgi:hypothetical protein